ncbi:MULTISPECIES: AAA family ATPase [Halolamina]|uniref:CobQ/CobB/MinD/ParA nucleotide binding domain-containing protein n=1 Tax=Halolamina pelagica TaxID=699431 RepID=A0A1I5SAZ3_9EURY|nr:MULTISPECIES: AAA family ATPase [Halolamina]NHX37143.1 ParA family protein [Halolamina sp. R1-12]SFP67889.1 CobQ/CobB/MinD/ParA nucleotide binding domain-containing protein [Halolamina pelagica]
MAATTAALVGATGGAGTTRTCLELASALAVAGDDVAVLDAAYDTQGIARRLSGRLDPDATALVTDESDAPLADGLVEFDPDADRAALDAEALPDPGRIACLPARAPFERLARAKTAEAAQELERRIEEAASTFDRVLVDVPPLGSNPGVAAATAADRVAVVTPVSERGVDAAQTVRGRLQDVGTNADAIVAVDRDGTGGFPEADAGAVLPQFSADAPAALETESGVAAIAGAADAVLDRRLDLPLAEGGLVDRVASLREN